MILNLPLDKPCRQAIPTSPNNSSSSTPAPRNTSLPVWLAEMSSSLCPLNNQLTVSNPHTRHNRWITCRISSKT